MSFPLIMQAGSQLVGGILGGMRAKRLAETAAHNAELAKTAIAREEQKMGEVINPYIGHTNLAHMATDLSRNMTNPMANLGVATQAAEMQAEEADIALVNTLDTLRATGAGAGGATALAQAALRSKKGIAASIESQEATNKKLRAQGQANLESRIAAEQARIQGVEIGEAQRMQKAKAAGEAYKFEAQENRSNTKINRLYQEQMQWASAAGAYSADAAQAWGGVAQSALGMFAPGGLFAKK